LAKLLLSHLGMTVVSHIVGLGDAVTTSDSHVPGPMIWTPWTRNTVRCFDPVATEAMVAAVKAAAKEGDSLGGVARCWPTGCRWVWAVMSTGIAKLDALLAQALMSIQAVKAVEIGEGWTTPLDGARRHTTPSGSTRTRAMYAPRTGPAGVEGGISNGALLVARVAMEPLATLNRPVLETVDMVTKESTVSFGSART